MKNLKRKLDFLKNFKNLSPYTKFEFTGLCITLLTEPIGLNILVKQFKIKLRLVAILLLFGTYILCSIRTVHLFRNSIFQLLETICIFGIGIPVSSENVFVPNYLINYEILPFCHRHSGN